MAKTSGLNIHQLLVEIRFVQGYRYLDRCGETLIQLENILDEGWIPYEPTPASGTIKNDVLGMIATFNSNGVICQQDEFHSFEHFRDQTCKIYETIWRTLEIETINAPAFRVVVQKGFKDGEIDLAQDYLSELNLCVPNQDLVSFMQGKPSAFDFTLVTECSQEWNGLPTQRRRRIQAKVIRQEQQRPFDQRILKRVRLLDRRQQDAMSALAKLRRQHPNVAPVAAQFDLEDVLESEFVAKDFDLPMFVQETWDWADTFRNQLLYPQKKNKNG